MCVRACVCIYIYIYMVYKCGRGLDICGLRQPHSARSTRATFCPRHGVSLLFGDIRNEFLKKTLLTLSLANARYNAEEILKTSKHFIKDTYLKLSLNFVKIAKNSDTPAFVVNRIFNNVYPLPVYFYCTWCMDKYTGQIMRKIKFTLVHTSVCVLNFMLPACRPNFAEVARAT